MSRDEAPAAVEAPPDDITPPNRYGNWLVTASGRKFWPLDPRSDEVHAEDICAHLARICRWNGALIDYAWYTVADHSVMVAQIAFRAAKAAAKTDARDYAFAGLIHDAAEAYLGDCPRPLKVTHDMRPFRAAEIHIIGQVASRLGARWDCLKSDIVRQADDLALAVEARDLTALKPEETDRPGFWHVLDRIYAVLQAAGVPESDQDEIASAWHGAGWLFAQPSSGVRESYERWKAAFIKLGGAM